MWRARLESTSFVQVTELNKMRYSRSRYIHLDFFIFSPLFATLFVSCNYWLNFGSVVTLALLFPVTIRWTLAQLLKWHCSFLSQLEALWFNNYHCYISSNCWLNSGTIVKTVILSFLNYRLNFGVHAKPALFPPFWQNDVQMLNSCHGEGDSPNERFLSIDPGVQLRAAQMKL